MVQGSSKTLSQLQIKYDNLRESLEKMGSALIAFSAGVDSTVLLKVAKEVLGDKAAAVTARSCFVPQREIDEAQQFCQSEDIKHFIVDIDPLAIDGVDTNPANRCYLCKQAIFSEFIEIAKKHGYKYVCEGSNASDLGDFRPGRKAIEELEISSPLLDAGFAKDEIRVLGLSLGIPNWSKPTYSCLATRFVTGSTITREALEMVDRAEELLLGAEFEQVRVRIHEVGGGASDILDTSGIANTTDTPDISDTANTTNALNNTPNTSKSPQKHNYLARIEVEPDEMEDLYEFATNSDFVAQMHDLGFAFITFDLEGYRTGSTNLP